jgi:hypothetical protein
MIRKLSFCQEESLECHIKLLLLLIFCNSDLNLTLVHNFQVTTTVRENYAWHEGRRETETSLEIREALGPIIISLEETS